MNMDGRGKLPSCLSNTARETKSPLSINGVYLFLRSEPSTVSHSSCNPHARAECDPKTTQVKFEVRDLKDDKKKKNK